ncbi:MAG: hypothetical protein GY774_39995 [Planctomycetes bacterium]|nr:hypothetical protein [Planctomycetota bacterium]
MSNNGNGRTAEQVIDAIMQSRGFASSAADLLGVSRSTFYRYLEKYATAKQTLKDTREKRHDYVESKLMKLIEGGNVASTIFYLKTQCKERGYVERFEQEQQGSIEILVKYADSDSNDP